ncbi:DUF2834 domain-containing protein [Parvularcula sp. ZS-1/3]|uniref:DUF2834 domain-containing protein n=1 Tax=Parvularcula mediterranea TaxID=2732508 RepID=A0A7Y3RJ80_9PROT|nr:DUF2834 domain-containing protein [Parvularcula mediterranea]NNU15063.1 DUF2834 domain-containing protein [Parvularcula mediterranea]
MHSGIYKAAVGALGAGFTLFFLLFVLPPALKSGDLIGAFGGGFVNPFATGYSVDVILCGLILIVWILYEQAAVGIRHGWICIPLVIVPGVASAFALYLLLRTHQLSKRPGPSS